MTTTQKTLSALAIVTATLTAAALATAGNDDYGHRFGFPAISSSGEGLACIQQHKLRAIYVPGGDLEHTPSKGCEAM
jgi:hypothetical protein